MEHRFFRILIIKNFNAVKIRLIMSLDTHGENLLKKFQRLIKNEALKILIMKPIVNMIRPWISITSSVNIFLI